MSLNDEPMEISKDLMNKDERPEPPSLWNISFDLASSKDVFCDSSVPTMWLSMKPWCWVFRLLGR